MKKVNEIVQGCHQKILDDAGIEAISNLGMRMSRENGIDSLGMVTLVLSVEEELGIELDQHLSKIRNAHYIEDFVNIIENIINTKDGGII